MQTAGRLLSELLKSANSGWVRYSPFLKSANSGWVRYSKSSSGVPRCFRLQTAGSVAPQLSAARYTVLCVTNPAELAPLISMYCVPLLRLSHLVCFVGSPFLPLPLSLSFGVFYSVPCSPPHHFNVFCTLPIPQPIMGREEEMTAD